MFLNNQAPVPLSSRRSSDEPRNEKKMVSLGELSGLRLDIWSCPGTSAGIANGSGWAGSETPSSLDPNPDHQGVHLKNHTL
jgi:hypothetical protein